MVDTDLVASWLTPATTCHHSITTHSWDSSLCKKPYRLPKKREAGGARPRGQWSLLMDPPTPAGPRGDQSSRGTAARLTVGSPPPEPSQGEAHAGRCTALKTPQLPAWHHRKQLRPHLYVKHKRFRKTRTLKYRQNEIRFSGNEGLA